MDRVFTPLVGASMATTAQRNVAYATASDERDLANAEHLTRADSFAGKPLPLFPEPSRNKVHWEHMLEEMSWLAKDFVRERKWRYACTVSLTLHELTRVV